jgi:hypothetical protein
MLKYSKHSEFISNLLGELGANFPNIVKVCRMR